MSTSSPSRDEMFQDCALVEIIHLHGCLRGALKALVNDVEELASQVCTSDSFSRTSVTALENKVSERFGVIWSVFKAHSSAEDEYIWPVLKSKASRGGSVGAEVSDSPDDSSGETLDQEKYEIDHAEEDQMFTKIDAQLSLLRTSLQQSTIDEKSELAGIAKDIVERTIVLKSHLEAHMQKEKSQCLPLVVKYFTKAEIHDLVGKVMGKRSADTVRKIMTMAMQNLEEEDRLEMVKYMREALSGTFFDRWLQMSGWTSFQIHSSVQESSSSARKVSLGHSDSGQPLKRRRCSLNADDDTTLQNEAKRATFERRNSDMNKSAQLDKFIRAVSTNPALTAPQKRVVIQGLKDSVRMSLQRESSGENPAADQRRQTVV